MIADYQNELLKKATAVYVSGPISGRDRVEASDHFSRATDFLLENYPNLRVVNPMEYPALDTWENTMKRDIAWQLACDAIFMLEGWEDSRGASLEHHIAQILNYYIIIEDHEAR